MAESRKADRRDLDVRVIRALGWKTESLTYKGERGTRFVSPTGKAEIGWNDTVPTFVPAFSSNLGVSWSLVEQLRGGRGRWEFIDRVDLGWQATLITPVEEITREAPTLPEAITLTALSFFQKEALGSNVGA